MYHSLSFPWKLCLKKLRFFNCLFFLIFFLSPQTTWSSEWTPVFEEEDIKVWEKVIKGSSVVAFRGEMTSNSNIHELFTVLYDADHKKDFLQNVIEFRVLKIINPYEGLSYVKVGNNFPFIDDRDVLLQSKIESLPLEKKIVVHFKNSPLKLVPLKDDTVRIPKLKGHWTFKVISPEKTKVFYEVESDPGGLIPKWLVNLANKRLPFRTLKKLRSLSKKKDVFKETAATIKYFFDFKPFLGDTHPASLRTKEEAIEVQAKIKTAFKEACEAGDKEACSPSKKFTLEYLK